MIERRAILRALAAGVVGSVIGARPGVAAEPPPETTRIRLSRYPFDVACVAPQWVAEELLRAEGFKTIEYVSFKGDSGPLATGNMDITFYDAPGLILAVDEGHRLVGLGGMHGGCYELFGSTRVHSVAELRGRTVAVSTPGRHAFVAAMASYVGLDPRKDLKIVLTEDAKQQFVEGKVDAVLGFPPEPQELRARKIGHAIVNTTSDRPWSQYFCCFATGNRDFVRKHPVATKRALRSLVKAVDICAAEPDKVVRGLVDRGFLKDHDYSLQALRELPYRRWREYDSADTIRFLALRMHEAGVIKSSPQKIIADGMDWRFVNELKKELKGLTRFASRTVAGLAAACVLSVAMPALAHQPGRDVRLPTIGAAPPFALTTADGGRLALADLRGKVVAVTFIYATCADTCPLLTAKLAGLGRRMGKDFGAKVAFVAITVDPERDTPDVLRSYAQAHGAHGAGWAFLTGTPAEIKDVTQRYGVFARKTDRGDVDHTFLTSLVDRAGALRVQYMGVRFDPDEMLRDLRSLLREGGR